MPSEDRPRVSADLLVTAVGAGTHRVTSAWIHPYDLEKIDLLAFMKALGVSAILPSHAVERGYLHVNVRSTRT